MVNSDLPLYRVFPITNSLRSQLSWTQYRLLMRLDPGSTANILKKHFKISEGLFISTDLRDVETPLMLHNITANAPRTEESLSLVAGTNMSFDAFFITDTVTN